MQAGLGSSRSAIRSSFRLGIPRIEMQEIIRQMTVYVGNPYVMQAMAVFERVANAAKQTAIDR